jgi:Tol biopolymer transport system component
MQRGADRTGSLFGNCLYEVVFSGVSDAETGGLGTKLTLIDVDTKETRLLLTGKQATEFQQIMWNMAWSPNSKRIVFYGSRSAGPGVAVVSVEGSDAEFKLLAADGVSANFSWNPDGHHILMSRAGLLHEYDIETDKIAPMPGHSADPAKDGAVWDPTGRLIVFIGAGKPQSVEWK